MVRVVRTPLCIAEALRNEEPFFIGVAYNIPDTKPVELKKGHVKSKPVFIVPAKPPQPLAFGDEMEEMEW